MCGIIGYIGDESAGPIIYEGLENLEYRGYDSAGIALVSDDGITVKKCAGAVEALSVPTVPNSTCGIGHTRWSTHGPPTQANAHPHLDCNERVAVVHNGIIENHDQLRTSLDGHEFTSDTDTEVVAHLLETELATDQDLRLAVEAVANQLEGSYAICVVDTDGDRIVATRDRSPLVIGHGEKGVFVASDIPAFLEHTRSVTYLSDGAIAELSDDGVSVYESGDSIDIEIENVDWKPEAAQKGGYEHYMRKEIHEQPRSLRQTLAERMAIDDGVVDLDVSLPQEYLNSLEEIQFIGAGTSYYACRYAALLFEEFADVRTKVNIASEYNFGGGRDPWRTLCVAVTQSGETKDTLDAIRQAASTGARTLAVTNVQGSSITREVDDTLFIRAGPEIGVAATKTFASQVATLSLLSLSIGHQRKQLSRTHVRDRLTELDSLPGAIQQVLDQEDVVRDIAEDHLDSRAFFFVGRRYGYPVALEGALKLKEISYDHAEGYAAGELKHGPLALVTESTPIVAVLTDKTDAQATLHNVAEAQARGAPTIGIVNGNIDTDRLDAAMTVPATGFIEPLVANVYLQLFAYHIAKIRDRPIDKPRNLAKSVTVD